MKNIFPYTTIFGQGKVFWGRVLIVLSVSVSVRVAGVDGDFPGEVKWRKGSQGLLIQELTESSRSPMRVLKDTISVDEFATWEFFGRVTEKA
jgi:hypothetical protein